MQSEKWHCCVFDHFGNKKFLRSSFHERSEESKSPDHPSIESFCVLHSWSSRCEDVNPNAIHNHGFRHYNVVRYYDLFATFFKLTDVFCNFPPLDSRTCMHLGGCTKVDAMILLFWAQEVCKSHRYPWRTKSVFGRETQDLVRKKSELLEMNFVKNLLTRTSRCMENQEHCAASHSI